MKLSVVVISFNQRAFIERLVAQLLDQDFEADEYEVIVVECASTDGTFEWLKQQTDARIIPLILPAKCNRSFARNRGIEVARGEVVVMIDGDHTVNRNFLSVHWQAHQGRECAIVGKSDFADHPDYVAINFYLNGGGAAKLPLNEPLPGRYFLTRNCSVPKHALLSIGLFDESFDLWGGEDLDLGVRIENASIPIYGEPRVLAIHHHFRGIHELLENLKLYGRDGVPLLVQKHPRLFRELNLDRLFSNPFEQNRFSTFYRTIMRMLCSAPVYEPCKWLAHAFRNKKLPRVLFDYLHLRQYAYGFKNSGALATFYK